MARFAIIDAERVTNIIEADAGFAAGIGAIDAEGASIGWSYIEGVFTPPVGPTLEEQAQAQAQAFQAVVVTATQARLDNFAKTRNYDGILSACTYASSAISKFAGEGQAAVNLRDSTWATLYQVLADVQNNVITMPGTVEEVVALLPELIWPV